MSFAGEVNSNDNIKDIFDKLDKGLVKPESLSRECLTKALICALQTTCGIEGKEVNGNFGKQTEEKCRPIFENSAKKFTVCSIFKWVSLWI